MRPCADSDTCRVPTRPSSWASGGIRPHFVPVWCSTSPIQACLARDPKGPSTSSCRKETCVGLRKDARDHAYVVVVSHSWVLLNSIRSALTHALPRLPSITLSTVFGVHPKLRMGMLALLLSCLSQRLYGRQQGVCCRSAKLPAEAGCCQRHSARAGPVATVSGSECLSSVPGCSRARPRPAVALRGISAAF